MERVAPADVARRGRPAVGLVLLAGVVIASAVGGCGPGPGAAPSSAPTPTGSVVPSPSDSGAPSTAGVAGELIRFAAADGVELEGRLFGAGQDGVVLAHMRPASMDAWFPFARALADEGYTALAFNFRGYGDSGGSGFAVDADVRAAIHALLDRGAVRVFAIGASMGGTGALAAAVGEERVAGVITLSAPASFEGVDAMAAIVRLDCPVLLMAGESDEPYASDAAALQEATGFEAELVILAGRRHGTDLFAEHGDALHDTILGFLADPT